MQCVARGALNKYYNLFLQPLVQRENLSGIVRHTKKQIVSNNHRNKTIIKTLFVASELIE
jgi:hypothetical protein